MTIAATSATRAVFYGFGAWVGRLDARTVCSWWADDPNNLGFDPKLLITADLEKNPRTYLAGAIRRDEIQVDDAPCDGGLTKLGPTWPTGSTINGIWLESSYYERLASAPPFPQRFMDCEPYELTTVLYWDATGRGAPRRFWGVHAELAAEQGPLGLCTIWTPGTSRTQRPAGSWWVDLATQTDPISNGLTTIGLGPSLAKRGALFVDAAAAKTLGLAGPKIPPWAGGQSIPLPKR